MTEAKKVFPGYYNLIRAEIAAYNSSEYTDISALIPRFMIEESLDYDCIRGHISVHDAVGFLENLPARGEETLILEIEDALGFKRQYELFIYKINNVTIKDTNDGLAYDMHFVSKSRFEASRHRIRRSFDTTTANIVETIYGNYYPAGKEMIVEQTEGSFRCVIPNYTPMQAINFLSNRSYSVASPSCSFRFFENYDNYFFVSDEYLFNNAKNNDIEIKEFTYSDKIDKSGKEFIAQMQNLKSIRNTDRVNTMQDLFSGAYRSNSVELDLVRGKVNFRQYNYLEEKEKYTSTAIGETESVHSTEFIEDFFSEENERRYIVVKDYSSDDDIQGQLRGEQYIPEIVSNRVAYRQRLNNTVVSATAPGRFDVKAGDVIRLMVPTFSSQYDPTKSLNKQLSGYYLVYECANVFVHFDHELVLKLVKFDWEEDVE